jgi:hypothetical protein
MKVIPKQRVVCTKFDLYDFIIEYTVMFHNLPAKSKMATLKHQVLH